MRRCVVVLLIVLGLAPAAFAQITAGTVSGTIKDETGGILPGVDVVIKNRDTGVTRTAVTDGNGAFTVTGLLPGPYEVRSTLSGFQTDAQQFPLTVAQTAALNITLKVGSASETVNVSATAVLTDSRTSALSALVPEEDDRGAAAQRPQLHQPGDLAARDHQFHREIGAPRRARAGCS